MLLIGTCLLWNHVVLAYSVNSSFAPTQHVLEKHEVAPSKRNINLKDVYEHLLSFFRPVTCRHKDKQTLIPCHVGEGLNATECLENKCCPSTTSHELKCYKPFKDNVQLAFRLLMLVAGAFLVLGCLPFYCCTCLQRRAVRSLFRGPLRTMPKLSCHGCAQNQCANPLRRANKEVEQIVQRKRAHSKDIYSLSLDGLKKDSKDHKNKKKEEHPPDLEDLKQEDT